MILGRSVVVWLVIFFIAICVFYLGQWLIPLLFALIGVAIPARIVNVLALLIAAGVVWGGWYRGGVIA